MRKKLVFGARFLAILLALYAIVALNQVNDSVVVPFTAAVTRVAAVSLRLADRNVHSAGTVITSERFAIDVKNGCNAVEVMILFAAAVLAFPAPVRFRLAGLAVGLPLIQLLNVIRLTSLFWFGSRHPA